MDTETLNEYGLQWNDTQEASDHLPRVFDISLDDAVGIKHLKILHLNDSKGELNSNRDRHDHKGLGEIGKEGLSEIIKTMNKHKIPIVLETPIDDRRDDFGNIKQAKSLA